MRIGLPSRMISPASGVYTPDSIFIRVLLPAPFSPITAWISPLRTVRCTPRSARVAPKRFSMPRISK
jgi:hypothetical protein